MMGPLRLGCAFAPQGISKGPGILLAGIQTAAKE